MTRYQLIIVNFCLFQGLAYAQLPQNIDMKLESTTVKLSNFQVITCPKLIQDENGTRPIDPTPFVSDKLYPPNTLFFIKFDFETDLQPSDDPKAIRGLTVAVKVIQTPKNAS